jgi:1-acyl-sn-glycerol-3-phosphate acyltransferase
MTDESTARPIDQAAERPSHEATTIMRFVRATIAQVLAGLFRTRLVGLENVPAGGVVMAGNHQSYLDPVLLWIKNPRIVHFIAKAELWQNPFYGWVLNNAGALPIDRSTVDRTAITTATKLVSAGEPVGIFPVGTRVRGKLGEANEVAAFIAARADVPIVPVGIIGTDRVMPDGTFIPRFPRVTISFGPPIVPSEYTEGGRKERIAQMTRDVMAAISAEIERVEEAGA